MVMFLWFNVLTLISPHNNMPLWETFFPLCKALLTVRSAWAQE